MVKGGDGLSVDSVQATKWFDESKVDQDSAGVNE
jgi:hypothetical protein